MNVLWFGWCGLHQPAEILSLTVCLYDRGLNSPLITFVCRFNADACNESGLGSWKCRRPHINSIRGPISVMEGWRKGTSRGCANPVHFLYIIGHTPFTDQPGGHVLICKWRRWIRAARRAVGN